MRFMRPADRVGRAQNFRYEEPIVYSRNPNQYHAHGTGEVARVDNRAVGQQSKKQQLSRLAGEANLGVEQNPGSERRIRDEDSAVCVGGLD